MKLVDKLKANRTGALLVEHKMLAAKMTDPDFTALPEDERMDILRKLCTVEAKLHNRDRLKSNVIYTVVIGTVVPATLVGMEAIIEACKHIKK